MSAVSTAEDVVLCACTIYVCAQRWRGGEQAAGKAWLWAAQAQPDDAGAAARCCETTRPPANRPPPGETAVHIFIPGPQFLTKKKIHRSTNGIEDDGVNRFPGIQSHITEE